MVKVDKYDFSFTAFSLRVNDMLKVAEAHHQGKVLTKAELGDGNSITGKKRLAEINKRLNAFTEEQYESFLSGDLTSQKQLAFLSVCKAHSFIREFVVEVLREKVLVFDYELSEGEYISFYRRKNELHPEMDDLTESTQRGIKQVTFKILEQAGIIDNTKTKSIQPQLLEDQLVDVIASDDKQWLKVLFMSDMDIQNLER
ncbi:DUF1819 family protein [Flavobacteriales bacterium]|nr:DUF1819 family protein [Flavobacteriales bacterium]